MHGVVVLRLIKEACRVTIDFGSVAPKVLFTHRDVVKHLDQLAHAAVPGPSKT
jgi:hypothetical protein